MKTKYQLVVLGDNHLKDEIIETFIKRVDDLGLESDSTSIIDETNFSHDYKPNSPTVCLYFGIGGIHANLGILDLLINHAVFILPIVSNLATYSNLVPAQLKSINGFELKNEKDIESLVARIMEGLSLLRAARRLFISYRRVESRSVAIQLYEKLDQCGFDVFLDTHSIRPGDSFQDELWHRLVDTDVVVLLDTPGFLDGEWTMQELAKASAMSIGVLQIIWPEHLQKPYSTLCYPYYLINSDFVKSDFRSPITNLTDEALKAISSDVESLRARSLASRQDNLIEEFTSTAKRMKISVDLQPEKFLTLTKKNGNEIAIIPTVGVPQSLTYNQTEELIKRIRKNKLPEIFLLYDHRNIIEKWQKHLIWLDLYLPIKAVKVTEIENWIAKL